MEDSEIQTNDLTTNVLTKKWDSFLAVRGQLVQELLKIAEDLPGDEKREFESIVDWLKDQPTAESMLLRADILALCLPLIERLPETGSLAELSIPEAAREGYCKMRRNGARSQKLMKKLLYPFLILACVSVLVVVFSFWVAPQFEEIYSEFGIGLPGGTQLVLGFASYLRTWWGILPMLGAGAVCFWFFNRGGSNRRPANLTWLDHEFMGTRSAIASWAWHISLLLEAGLGSAEAIRTAGLSSSKTWLRLSSRAWASELKQEQLPGETQYFYRDKFQLVNNAMKLPPSEGKVAALQQAALYYWDRTGTLGDWWIEWLVAIFLWVVGAAFIGAVFMLFLPLFQLVGGLTG